MSDSREILAQTEKRLAEVEALQLSLRETQLELNAYADLLRQKVAALRELAAPKAPAPQVAMPTPAPVKPRPAVAKPVAPASAPPQAPPPGRKAKPTMSEIVMPAETPDEEPVPDEFDEEAEEAAFAERRAEPRRKGNPVSVQVTHAPSGGDPVQGWVVDRSSGGLRILVDQEIKPGTVLNVRPTKSHPGFTWVQVKVKSCRPERSSYNLGCQFTRKLTWTELQVFG